jgi:hypothetical protein
LLFRKTETELATSSPPADITISKPIMISLTRLQSLSSSIVILQLVIVLHRGILQPGFIDILAFEENSNIPKDDANEEGMFSQKSFYHGRSGISATTIAEAVEI